MCSSEKVEVAGQMIIHLKVLQKINLTMKSLNSTKKRRQPMMLKMRLSPNKNPDSITKSEMIDNKMVQTMTTKK